MTFTGFPLIEEETNTTCSSFFHSSAFFCSPQPLWTTRQDRPNAQRENQLEGSHDKILSRTLDQTYPFPAAKVRQETVYGPPKMNRESWQNPATLWVPDTRGFSIPAQEMGRGATGMMEPHPPNINSWFQPFSPLPCYGVEDTGQHKAGQALLQALVTTQSGVQPAATVVGGPR